MIRLIRLLIALACLAAGVVVGALNPQAAVLDFGFAQATSSLGVIVIVSLLIGVVAGGLALAASVVIPLRNRLRRAERVDAPRPPSDRQGP
ncbi:LapA family protein [Lysobacter sp. A6]|uniref:LapA family protein n=1 Tax=Noviluteimonas lactosilytica TaxID=2888523 RepID=A0ABS8JD98_9GAMM|nr:LapA family protein [Lysobacter lactosilyticus]MCC8361510.1 LapA family protein [Lysobacter lactosilyticus]